MSRYIVKNVRVPNRGASGFTKEYYVYDTMMKCSWSGTCPDEGTVKRLCDSLNKMFHSAIKNDLGRG